MNKIKTICVAIKNFFKCFYFYYGWYERDSFTLFDGTLLESTSFKKFYVSLCIIRIKVAKFTIDFGIEYI